MCAYDHFVYTGQDIQHQISEGQIFNFTDYYNINQSFSLEISDHYPIETQLNVKQASTTEYTFNDDENNEEDVVNQASQIYYPYLQLLITIMIHSLFLIHS